MILTFFSKNNIRHVKCKIYFERHNQMQLYNCLMKWISGEILLEIFFNLLTTSKVEIMISLI